MAEWARKKGFMKGPDTWDYQAQYNKRLGANVGTEGSLRGAIKLNPLDMADILGDELTDKSKKTQSDKQKIRLQSEGKTSLLNQQTTRSKGGGKSGGGGGGKWGWIRRALNRPASPWSLLKTNKNF